VLFVFELKACAGQREKGGVDGQTRQWCGLFRIRWQKLL